MKFCYSLLVCGLILCGVSKAQTLNYYYGNLHAHSGYSDGNQDSASSGCSTPAQDYAYAKLSQNFDFLGISEHNHFSSGNPGMKLSSYAPGLAQAAAATTSTFLAMFGMEWGVSSSTNGHVIIYGFSQLIGWEAGNYNIFNDKVDYDGLFKKVKNNPNAFCYLAHPYTTDFNYLAVNPYNATYDSAIVGVPFRSGIYNSTNTSYSHYPAGDYFSYYLKLLALGYHVGMGYDHDNHNTTFGRSTGGRLVILAPSLTEANLVSAMKQRHFYGSDDMNVKIDLKIGSSVMGDTTSGFGSPLINITHNDPDAELADSIKLFAGIPGSSQATMIANSKSLNTLSYTDNSISTGMTKYYFAEIKQADGQRIVTSPIWYKMKGTIGVQEYHSGQGFVLFPNPATSEINLSTGLNTSYTVDILDISGRKVFSEVFTQSDVRIPTNKLAKGFYTVRITAENFSKQRSLVVE
jgi:hypothetical protein